MNPILINKLKANIQKEYNQEELLMAQNALKSLKSKNANNSNKMQNNINNKQNKKFNPTYENEILNNNINNEYNSQYQNNTKPNNLKNNLPKTNTNQTRKFTGINIINNNMNNNNKTNNYGYGNSGNSNYENNSYNNYNQSNNMYNNYQSKNTNLNKNANNYNSSNNYSSKNQNLNNNIYNNYQNNNYQNNNYNNYQNNNYNNYQNNNYQKNNYQDYNYQNNNYQNNNYQNSNYQNSNYQNSNFNNNNKNIRQHNIKPNYNSNTMTNEENDNRPIGGGMENSKNNPEMGEAKGTCSHCGRQFVYTALEKHEKICQKVFQNKRKAFNTQQQRIKNSEQAVLMKQGQIEEKKKEKMGLLKNKNSIPKWKLQSEEFRQICRADTNNNSNNNSTFNNNNNNKFNSMANKYANYKPSVITDSYIPCKFCNRKYNEEAYNKHLAGCERRYNDAQLKNKFRRNSGNTMNEALSKRGIITKKK